MNRNVGQASRLLPAANPTVGLASRSRWLARLGRLEACATDEPSPIDGPKARSQNRLLCPCAAWTAVRIGSLSDRLSEARFVLMTDVTRRGCG